MNRKTSNSAERAFPEIVQVGSAYVKIYHTPKNGRDAFTVSYTLLGDRHRDYFSEYVDAKAAAKDAAARINRGDQDVLSLRNQDRMIYLRALEALAGIDKPLDIVALEFAEAFKISKGTSMVELAKFYVQHRNEKSITPKFTGDIVAELLQAKTLAGRSAYHIKDLRCRLRQFSNAFSCPLANVSSPQVATFIKNLKVTPRSKNNVRRVIGILFTFAQREGYVSRTHPGIKEVDYFTVPPSEITTFTPAQLQIYLRSAAENMVPYLAIAAFAGLRQEEIKRLCWEDFKWEAGYIEVKAKNAKMRDRRLVPLLPNLNAWLLPYQDDDC